MVKRCIICRAKIRTGYKYCYRHRNSNHNYHNRNINNFHNSPTIGFILLGLSLIFISLFMFSSSSVEIKVYAFFMIIMGIFVFIYGLSYVRNVDKIVLKNEVENEIDKIEREKLKRQLINQGIYKRRKSKGYKLKW